MPFLMVNLREGVHLSPACEEPHGRGARVPSNGQVEDLNITREQGSRGFRLSGLAETMTPRMSSLEATLLKCHP